MRFMSIVNGFLAVAFLCLNAIHSSLGFSVLRQRKVCTQALTSQLTTSTTSKSLLHHSSCLHSGSSTFQRSPLFFKEVPAARQFLSLWKSTLRKVVFAVSVVLGGWRLAPSAAFAFGKAAETSARKLRLLPILGAVAVAGAAGVVLAKKFANDTEPTISVEPPALEIQSIEEPKTNTKEEVTNAAEDEELQRRAKAKELVHKTLQKAKQAKLETLTANGHSKESDVVETSSGEQDNESKPAPVTVAKATVVEEIVEEEPPAKVVSNPSPKFAAPVEQSSGPKAEANEQSAEVEAETVSAQVVTMEQEAAPAVEEKETVEEEDTAMLHEPESTVKPSQVTSDLVQEESEQDVDARIESALKPEPNVDYLKLDSKAKDSKTVPHTEVRAEQQEKAFDMLLQFGLVTFTNDPKDPYYNSEHDGDEAERLPSQNDNPWEL